MKHILILIGILLCFIPNGYSQGNNSPIIKNNPKNEERNEKQQKGRDELLPAKTREKTPEKDQVVEDLEPVQNQGISLGYTLAFDLLVPGGGHFYRNDYLMGGGFFLAKGLAAYSIFYNFKKRDYYHSLYRAAKKANDSMDPDHTLYFKDPEGGYKSAMDYKHDYDRTAQMITFSAVGLIALYVASVYMNYYFVQDFNERTIPTFEFNYSRVGIENKEYMFMLSYTYRI